MSTTVETTTSFETAQGYTSTPTVGLELDDIVQLPVTSPEPDNYIINAATDPAVPNNVSLANDTSDIISNNISSTSEPPESIVIVPNLKFSEPADVALACLIVVMCVVALSGIHDSFPLTG